MQERCIDAPSPLQGFEIDENVGQGVEVGHRPPSAHVRPFETQRFGLAIDALSTGALLVDTLIERTVAIQRDAHQPAGFPIQIFDAASSLGELDVITRFRRALGKEQRAAKALGAIAIGVSELEGGLHAQAFGAQQHPIAVA